VTAGALNSSFTPISNDEIVTIEASGNAWHVGCYDANVRSCFEGMAEEGPHLCWLWKCSVRLRHVGS